MPSSVLVVGTSAGLAIYRPAADGGSWDEIGATLAAGAVHAIVAADAETLLVAVEGAGAQQSFDGGATWLPSPETPPAPVGVQVLTRNGPARLANPRLSGATAYARLPSQPPTLLGAGAGGALLFRSSDDGIHWEPARMPAAPVGRIATIAPDALSSVSAWAGSDSGVILHTTDSGRTWHIIVSASAPVLCLAHIANPTP